MVWEVVGKPVKIGAFLAMFPKRLSAALRSATVGTPKEREVDGSNPTGVDGPNVSFTRIQNAMKYWNVVPCQRP